MTLSIALAQLNPTVGDVAGNLARVRRARDRAAERGADLLRLKTSCGAPRSLMRPHPRCASSNATPHLAGPPFS